MSCDYKLENFQENWQGQSSRQHCRLTIWKWLVELTNSIRWRHDKIQIAILILGYCLKLSIPIDCKEFGWVKLWGRDVILYKQRAIMRIAQNADLQYICFWGNTVTVRLCCINSAPPWRLLKMTLNSLRTVRRHTRAEKAVINRDNTCECCRRQDKKV